MMKEILPSCSCKCHSNQSMAESKRPNMTQLHQFVQDRQWNKIKHAIRHDASVAMRIDDSAEEDKWFYTARYEAWKRSVCGSCVDAKDIDKCNTSNDPIHPNSTEQSEEDTNQSLPVRYWVPNQNTNGQSAIRQKRTLLHSISKLKFHSDEALIAQLSTGDCEELRDLVEASLTMKMIIDASVNELRPASEGCYNEENDQENLDCCLDMTCRNCCCYYQVMYCPLVFLDPVEKYDSDNDEEGATPNSDAPVKILHQSALTMPDALGATPLHLLTGEGSSHVDLVKVFLDGCLPTESDRRPSVHELLSAQNGHGCTPLHFLSDNGSEEVLQLILDTLQQEYTTKPSSQRQNGERNRIHPLLVHDNDGDLPLHYACSHGANAQLLSILTAPPGARNSIHARNGDGKQPIDELLIWYKGVFSMIGRGQLDSDEEQFDSDEEESSDETSDSEDSEDEHEDDASDASPSDPNPEEMIMTAMKCMFVQPLIENDAERSPVQLSLTPHCKYYLWDRMWVLIKAGAQSIMEQQMLEATGCIRADCSESSLIHAAIVVTKYFDFPAIALVASVLMQRDILAEVPQHNNANPSQLLIETMLQENAQGLLPLHTACNNILVRVPWIKTNRHEYSYISHYISITSCWPETVRWHTGRFQCSMIAYLLHLCPESAGVPTEDGQLPLHLYLNGGFEAYDTKYQRHLIWKDVKKLLEACPEAIRTPDKFSHLYPFQTAAAAAAANAADSSTRSHADANRIDDYRWKRSESDQLTYLELTYLLILEDPSLCCKKA